MKSNSTLSSLLSIVEPTLTSSGSTIHADIESVLQLADRNGLKYAVMQNWGQVNSLDEDMKSRRERISETISLIDRCARSLGIEYGIIKDCNTVPHLPRDVDILVNEEDKTKILEELEDRGCSVEEAGEIETAVTSSSGVSIDVYTRIQYFGVEFIEAKFLLENTQRRSVYGEEYEGLSDEGEHLLHLVHSFFGHRRMTLLDFIHLQRIGNAGIDDSICLRHAKEMGWESTYLYFRSELAAMRQKVVNDKWIKFPHLFNISVMIRSINKLNADVTGYDPAVLFSLLLDGIKLRIENTVVEESIKQIDPLRKNLLRIAYFSRKKRGDRYS